MMGQGVVLMVAGMGIVYVFLYVLIAVSKWTSGFVSRFDFLVAGDTPKKAARAGGKPAVQSAATGIDGGMPVKSPVPGTVLRISASNGQEVVKGAELLVLDVMKMETPITAPCPGRVSMRVAAMDKVATGDTVAVIE